jgi:hypothetical protein
MHIVNIYRPTITNKNGNYIFILAVEKTY